MSKSEVIAIYVVLAVLFVMVCIDGERQDRQEREIKQLREHFHNVLPPQYSMPKYKVRNNE